MSQLTHTTIRARTVTRRAIEIIQKRMNMSAPEALDLLVSHYDPKLLPEAEVLEAAENQVIEQHRARVKSP